MGALAVLWFGLAQVDDVQLIEPAGFYPDEAVIAGRRHGHKVEHHRSRQPVAVLVVGVVAAQLRTPRGRIHLHLPPRAEIEFELFQRGGVPLPLPGQHCRVCAAINAARAASRSPAKICCLSCVLVAIAVPPPRTPESLFGKDNSIVIDADAVFNLFGDLIGQKIKFWHESQRIGCTFC